MFKKLALLIISLSFMMGFHSENNNTVALNIQENLETAKTKLSETSLKTNKSKNKILMLLNLQYFW